MNISHDTLEVEFDAAHEILAGATDLKLFGSLYKTY